MRARAYSARLDEGGRVVSLDACVGPGSPGLTLSHGASHQGASPGIDLTALFAPLASHRSSRPSR